MPTSQPVFPPDRYLGVTTTEIVEQVGRGNTALFTRLFDVYVTPLVRWAYFLCRDKALAEDIVADVFTYIWEIRERWHVQTSVEAYLFGAVRVRARAVRRTDRRREKLLNERDASDELHGQPDTTPEEQFESKERQTYVHAILDALPLRQREAVYARWYREMSYDDIGTLLGISALAARQLVFRALTVLRHTMTAESEKK